MKLLEKITFLTTLITFTLFSQEPVRSTRIDSIASIINKSTNGIRFVLNDTGINSELNEIGTSFFKNKYIILSNKKRRHYKTTINENTNVPNNNLYCVDIKENGDLSFPLLFSSTLDSDNNEGSITFSPDEKTVYYTQESTEKDGKTELYKATLDLDSKKYWTNITKVNINTNGYSIETPCVSPDGKKLYFSSNMPGGKGGYDLYVSSINTDGTYGKPINLGANINSDKDEKYPNLTNDNKYLYFSSKGHLNIGGFDVYRSSIVEKQFLQALNMGTSLNSIRDDIAFVQLPEGKGYISTDKTESGNFNILKFETNQVEVISPTIKIIDKNTLAQLPNTTVIIKNEFGEITTEATTNNEGEFKMNLNPMSYNFITIEKDGYETFAKGFTSENLLNNPILLSQKQSLVVEEVIVQENLLFNFDKFNLSVESKIILNEIIILLNKNPETSLIINAYTDKRGSKKYNLKLSAKRAESAFKYIINKGISKDRITYNGLGESKPLIDCVKCLKEEHSKNRRIEFLMN